MLRIAGWDWIFLLLFSCMLLASSPSHAAVTDADLSSPAKALAAFCKALENGETADLTAVSFGDAKVQDWIGPRQGRLGAQRPRDRAVQSLWGDLFGQ